MAVGAEELEAHRLQFQPLLRGDEGLFAAGHQAHGNIARQLDELAQERAVLGVGAEGVARWRGATRCSGP